MLFMRVYGFILNSFGKPKKNALFILNLQTLHYKEIKPKIINMNWEKRKKVNK